MKLDVDVCKECGAHYARENYDTYHYEYGHQTWHREQEALLAELKALIKGEQK